jgi:glutathione synthase/RimK-type ligase-like ATP-grasp enzyme
MANFGGISAQAGLADAKLLLIFGADRNEEIICRGTTVHIPGSADLYRVLDGMVPFHRLQMTRSFFRQHRRPELSTYRYIMNMVTEPERNPQVLENIGRLVRGAAAKVINRPEAILRTTRDLVARKLTGVEGLVAPRAVRLRAGKPTIAMQAVAKAGLSFPIILRETGTHKGEIVGLMRTADEMHASQVEGSDHFATEFIDFRSSDGLYRKYRVFFIGRHIVFRHMLVSDEWNVHAKDRQRFMAARPDLRAEEEAMFVRAEGAFPTTVLETLRQARDRINLDVFGMDFGLLPDGRVLLFESNASMNFFPFLADPEFAYVLQCREPAQRALRELLGLVPAEDSPRPNVELLE